MPTHTDTELAHAQYVFTWRCGCPRTVVDATTVADDVDAAWAVAAPLGAERRFLEAEGVTVELVGPRDYAARYGTPRSGCRHGGSR